MKRDMTQKQAFLEHGKLPPQAVDLEEMVLGAIMLEANKCLSLIISELSPEVFYKEAHQAIYQAILSLYDKSQPVDILTVTSELKSTGNLELSGGPFYITQLTSRVASSANIEYHTGIIVQKYLARELIRVSTENIRSAFEDTTDIFDLMDQADMNLQTINEFSVRGGSMMHISDAVTMAMEEAYRRAQNVKEGKSAGINTGLTDLNDATGGWRNKDLIIIAARPGMGKTAIALKHAYGAASSGVPVCIYSLEMGAESLANRMMYGMYEIDIDAWKKGVPRSQDWEIMNMAGAKISSLPIYVDPNPMVTMRYIRSNSRVMQKKGKCGMIIIDYLQLVDVSSADRNSNREQRVAEASRYSKLIAKELNIPVLLLCQMSRKVEERKDHEPELSDLRESGSIEQDADLVIFVFRPEYYGQTEDNLGNDLRGVGKLYIKKFRDGATNEVKFRYNESLTNIYDFHKTPEIALQPNLKFEQASLPDNPNF